MEKKFAVAVAVVLSSCLLSSCLYYQEPLPIVIPYEQSATGLPTGTASTRVIFQNYSSLAHIRIWAGRPAVDRPDLELEPEEGRAFDMPGVGVQTIILVGRERTTWGWRELGTRKRPVEIYPSIGVREIPVGDWDFYGSSLRLPWRRW